MRNATSEAANNLRVVRRARGIAVWGLAAKVGTSPATVSAIECWNYRPRVTLRERIAGALGVHVRDIWPE